MAYSKQTWDTTSYVNPTRMNHIEDGIKANSDRVFAMPTMYGAWTSLVPNGTRTLTFSASSSSDNYYKVECYTHSGTEYLYIAHGRFNRDGLAVVVNGSSITVDYDGTNKIMTITAAGNVNFPVLITATKSFSFTES